MAGEKSATMAEKTEKKDTKAGKKEKKKTSRPVKPQKPAHPRGKRTFWLEAAGLLVIGAGLFLMFCTVYPHLTGSIGAIVGNALLKSMGIASFSLAFLLIIIGIRMMYPFMMRPLVFLSLLVLICIWSIEILSCLGTAGGSRAGIAARNFLVNTIGVPGVYIVLAALIISALCLFLGSRAGELWALLMKVAVFFFTLAKALFSAVKKVLLLFFRILRAAGARIALLTAPIWKKVHYELNKNKRVKRSEEEIIEDLKEAARIAENFRIDIEDDDEPFKRPARKVRKKEPGPPAREEDEPGKSVTGQDEQPHMRPYRIPSLSMLEGAEVVVKNRKSSRDYSTILVETLESFGVSASVINIERGPSISRYELQPAKGVKVSKITNLTNDIALSLAAPSIRIEAPVRGKSCIGIEVPNDRIDVVTVKEILASEEFRNKDFVLPLAFGKDITGKSVVGDLVKMPHLLVAGSTGSGKSVCINCIIASLLFRALPTEVQLCLIDPKMVELSMYEGIPHLIDIKATPENRIITDPKIATLVLHQMTEIMDSRYREFKQIRARDIFEYNKKAESSIPYIVIIVDELADLMMVSSASVEKHICRLAQMGRAAGIHLIIATQRPSVDVITGLIKVNVPSRVAFAVTSQVDSRTILDSSGADKLLGKGDMLYMPIGAATPRRVQGAFISSDDIENIVAFWRDQPPPENLIPIDIEVKEAAPDGDNDGEDGEDALFQEALRIIMAERQASVSILQRKMKIGYARAGRIIDCMERKGLVGPAVGSKPRKILAGSEAAGAPGAG